MEFIVELVLELLVDGTIELSSNKKIPNAIRYPLIAIITLVGVALVLLILFIGIAMLNQSIIIGIIFIILGIVLSGSFISKFKKTYLEKKNSKVIKL